jgi:hypothetical protein
VELGTAPEGRVDGILSDGESATGGRLPDVLFVVVVFGDDLNALSDEIGGVETDTKLLQGGAQHENFKLDTIIL